MLSLRFADGDSSLSVRRAEIREAVSTPYEIDIVARSPDEALDLGALLGQPAALHVRQGATSPLRVAAGATTSRTFQGVCVAARQTAVEPTGLSTYEIRIVAPLWLLGQRTGHRVFQHLTTPQIASQILAEWGIEARWNVETHAHPALEYRVQYGESDLSFLDRLLEEAGIAYVLSTGGEDPEDVPRIHLHDRLASAAARPGGPILHHDRPDPASGRDHVTAVRLAHALRPGRVALHGFDFRRARGAPLLVEASALGDASARVEASAGAAAPTTLATRLEHHIYEPGAFFAERAPEPGSPVHGDTPVGDDRGVSRAEERTGRRDAALRLGALRADQRSVTFATNALDVVPGTVMSIDGHGHVDLAPDRPLLVTRLRMSGDHDGAWAVEASAVFTDVPYVPPRVTPKPRVVGVESAAVVGPQGEEIHTDELGRVRVHFHWDRKGERGPGSSCWMRVSQAWAGAAHGIMALPRVGDEVVVGFFGGDPDQPVVVGRLFNQTAPPPERLPEGRAVSTWRSRSTAGGAGWNEIALDDTSGAERVHVRAERNLETVVGRDASTTIGGRRSAIIAADDVVQVGQHQQVRIARGRSTSIGGADETTVQERFAVQVEAAQVEVPGVEAAQAEAGGAPRLTGLEVTPRKITLSTGEATLTLEGPNITLEAAAEILLNAAATITIRGTADIRIASGASVQIHAQDGDVVVQGSPNILLNPGAAREHDPAAIPVEPPGELDMDGDVLDAEDAAYFAAEEPRWLERQLEPGGAWDPRQWGAEHEAFGHFRVGVMAAAASIPLGIALRQMGKRQVAESGASDERGDPGNGLFGGKAPYGNDPEHADMMKRGARYHALNYAWADDDL